MAYRGKRKQMNRPLLPARGPSVSVAMETHCTPPTRSLMMLRKVLLKRMQNWVRQLAEKLWQPSMGRSPGDTPRGRGGVSPRPRIFPSSEPRKVLVQQAVGGGSASRGWGCALPFSTPSIVFVWFTSSEGRQLNKRIHSASPSGSLLVQSESHLPSQTAPHQAAALVAALRRTRLP